MNKGEMISFIANRCGVSKATAGRMMEAFIEGVANEIAAGRKVTLVGFGTFSAVRRPARVVRNPMTGEGVEVPASVVPKFKAGAGLRGLVTKKAGRVASQPSARPRSRSTSSSV